MLKKIVFGILLIGILVFAGITYYVSNLDWNTYKDTISQKFFELTGKQITFGGQLNISLLPQPVMKAENISIYNQGKKDKPLATIKTLETSVTLSSLLNEAPDITSLTLSDAKVWIEKEENGKYNWAHSDNEVSNLTSQKTNLHKLSLQNATFYYENKAADINLVLEKLNAELQTAAYDGPYRLDGNFSNNNEHYAIAIGVGSLSSIDGIEINFSLSHPSSESFFRFDGTYNTQEHNVKGDFSGGSQKTAQFINILLKEKLLDEQNQKELQFSSGVEFDDKLLKLSSFVTKYADDIEGSGSLTYPLFVEEGTKRQVDLKYEFLNIDLRPFYPIVLAQYEKLKEKEINYLPETNFNINADLAAKHLDFSDNAAGFLENITLKADWTDDIFTIEEFFASAIGDTSISISGDLREENTKPRYFLKNSIISTDFLSFANALDANLKSYVQSTYRNAEMNFSIVGDNESMSIENAELSMDKMNIFADFNASLSAENSEYSISIKTDTLNLDNYIPNKTGQNEFWAQLSEDAEQLKFLNKLNLNLNFSSDNLIFRGTPMDNVVINISDKKGEIKLSELSVQNIVGSQINLNGNINLAKEPIDFNDFNLSIDSQNIAGLVSQINFMAPDWELPEAKNVIISSVLNGNLNELNTQFSAKTDSVDVSYDGTIKNISDKPDFNGKLNLKTTDAAQLFNGLNLNSQMVPNSSALNCDGLINFSANNYDYKDIKCLIGTSEYLGDINITQNNEKYDVNAKIESNDFDLSYIFDLNQSKVANFGTENSFDNTFIARPDINRDNLDLSKFKDVSLNMELTAPKATLRKLNFNDLHLKIQIKNNLLKLEEIDTLYNNTHYTGDLSIAYANPSNSIVKGNLAFNDLDISSIGGSVYMINKGKISGNTSFESKGMSAYDILTNISGYVSMHVKDLSFKGFDFAAIRDDIAKRKYSKGLFQVIRDNLQQGETGFDDFDVTLAMKNGSLIIANLNLINSDAKSDLSADINLKDWKLGSKMVISINDVSDVPAFDVSLTGNLQKPSLEINIENMVRNYDEHWKQIEDQEKAQKEAERRELNTKMEAAQTSVEEFSALLNSYPPKYEKYKEKSLKEENINWYTNKLAEINVINSDLDSMKAKAHTPDFTENDINIIKDKIENYNNMILSWDNEIAEHYADDVDDRINRLINKKSDYDIKAQKLKSEYELKYNDKITDLSKINKQNNLTDNAEFMQQKSDFYSACEKSSALSAEIDKALLPLNTVTNTEQKDNLLIAAEDMSEDIEKLYLSAQEQQIALIDLVNNIYNQVMEEQANTNEDENITEENNINQNPSPQSSDTKLNEDISGQSDGSLLKKISSNNDISSSSDETGKEVQGSLLRSYEQKTENNVKKQTTQGLLKEADGAVKKASGTIIVK